MSRTELGRGDLWGSGPELWPTLRCRDAQAEMTFLEQAFGFTTKTVVAERDAISHAEMLYTRTSGIMLSSDTIQDGWDVPPGTGAIYLVAQVSESLFRAAVDAGADVLSPLHAKGRGYFVVRDPEGNRWAVGSYRGSGTLPDG